MTEKIPISGDGNYMKELMTSKEVALSEEINKIQKLPNEVVYNFIKCKGILISTKFKERYLNHVR